MAKTKGGLDLGLGNVHLHIGLLWLVVLFVLVSVIVMGYAGKNEKLGKREFPNTDVNGNLKVTGDVDIDGSTTLEAVTTKGNLVVNGKFLPGAARDSYATAARSALATSGATALAANTHYTLGATTGSVTLTLPTQANSTEGDFISVHFTGDVGNTNVVKFGTAGEFFTAGSIVKVRGNDATRVAVIDVADGTADDFLNITGATNGDGGIGTIVNLFFNGSTWSVDAIVEGQGAQTTASASTVFDTS